MPGQNRKFASAVTGSPNLAQKGRQHEVRLSNPIAGTESQKEVISRGSPVRLRWLLCGCFVGLLAIGFSLYSKPIRGPFLTTGHARCAVMFI